MLNFARHLTAATALFIIVALYWLTVAVVLSAPYVISLAQHFYCSVRVISYWVYVGVYTQLGLSMHSLP